MDNAYLGIKTRPSSITPHHGVWISNYVRSTDWGEELVCIVQRAVLYKVPRSGDLRTLLGNSLVYTPSRVQGLSPAK